MTLEAKHYFIDNDSVIQKIFMSMESAYFFFKYTPTKPLCVILSFSPLLLSFLSAGPLDQLD